jgi:hypothetical protein
MGAMGTYTKVGSLTQSGWPVYKRVGSTVQYLFFWPTFQRWLIGPDYETGLSSVQSGGGFAFGAERVLYAGSSSAADPVASENASSAVCPDEANDWVLFDGEGGWISTYPITVREGASEPPPAHATSQPPRQGTCWRLCTCACAVLLLLCQVCLDPSRAVSPSSAACVSEWPMCAASYAQPCRPSRQRR